MKSQKSIQYHIKRDTSTEMGARIEKHTVLKEAIERCKYWNEYNIASGKQFLYIVTRVVRTWKMDDNDRFVSSERKETVVYSPYNE